MFAQCGDMSSFAQAFVAFRISCNLGRLQVAEIQQACLHEALNSIPNPITVSDLSFCVHTIAYALRPDVLTGTDAISI